MIISGKQINFKTAGTGNALVLLHGFLESSNIWDEFSKRLSSFFQVITIDLPGHGQTQNFSTIHTMELMAELVKEVLDYLKVKKCVMIGHSMGGYVSLAFAEKYPSYLTGLGLFHSSAGADSPEARSNRDRTISAVKKDHLGFIQQFIPDLFAPENKAKFEHEISQLKEIAAEIKKESIIAALEGMKSRIDKFELLKQSEFPILFIVGKKDKRISVNAILEQAALPNRCEVQIYGDVGHMGYIEAKEDTLEIIYNFIKKCFKNQDSIFDKPS